jgi:hypothetical protein
MATTQDFNRYSIAVFDWQKSLVFADEAQKHPPNTTVYEALLFAAIVCYYRPFSNNERGKNPLTLSCLEIEDFPTLSQQEQVMHEHCKTLRNKALAHSEFSFNPTGVCKTTGVIASKPFSLLSQPFDLETFIHLLSKLELECHHKRGDRIREQQS